VTSVGGLPVELDAWGIDAAYSGTQKCLSCPPGLSPVSFSPRAQAVLAARKTPVQSWYLDLSLISNYWGSERAYHHTAPINMLYGLHEALRIALEEGTAAREVRHRLNASAFVAGIEALGLAPRVPEPERLPPLTAIAVPDGVEDARARAFLLERFDLEIGGGLGPMKGNTWRVGLMGWGSSRENVELCLGALTAALQDQGYEPARDALAAAAAVYSAG
jgi:alanine-glyoxylate transaminase/serine-glyoxylate transaminase/serine-pyruvate transaminase